MQQAQPLTIVFLPDISWFGLHQRPHHLALAFARKWRVLWVQPSVLTERSHFRPVRAEDNLYVLSVPAIPYNARSPLVKAIAQALSSITPFRRLLSFLQFRIVQRGLRAVGWNRAELVILIQNYSLFHLVGRMRPQVSAFDYIDNAFGFTKLPRHVAREWEKTVQGSDIVTVTSPTLEKQIRESRAENVYLVGNGVEYNVFATRGEGKRPSDLPRDGKIVVYVGAVYPWLDYELLRHAAQELGDIHFVLIGTVHPQVKSVVDGLARMSNVHVLGFRQYADIPLYLSYCNVGIIPFQKNLLTAAVNPVKLYEYSAAGKPTVATDFSADLQEFKEKIFIARSDEEFAENIRRALAKGQDPAFVESLRGFAREHDWNIKTSKIIDLIQQRLAAPNHS